MIVYGIVRYKTIFEEIFETEYAVIAHKKFGTGEILPRAPINLDAFKMVDNGTKKKKTGEA